MQMFNILVSVTFEIHVFRSPNLWNSSFVFGLDVEDPMDH